LSGSYPKHRYLALDGLRGVAALLVVLFHVQWPNHLTHTAFVGNAYLAVDLFFVLSGFVIAANNSARITDLGDLRRFICLRFFRIYPLHIATLLVLLALEVAKLIAQNAGAAAATHAPFVDGNSYAALIANILLVHGLGVLDTLGWNSPSWSISCEFAAYLVFALAAGAGVLRRDIWVLLGVLLACTTYGMIALTRETLDVTYDWGLLRCLSGFFLGVAVHHYTASGRMRRIASSWPAGVVAAGEYGLLLALVGVMSWGRGGAVVLVVPLYVAAIALFQLDRGPLARALASRPAQFLGRVSYSIYMVHFPVLIFASIFLKRALDIPVAFDPRLQAPVFDIDPWTGDLFMMVIVAIVLATAAVTFRLIEQPGQAIGRDLAASLRPRLVAGE
jgi:peptidoglycan/LPS O-acetylase OafA/YrhL